ncbi:MAG TPA: mannosyltransferase family protein [Thermoleophilaceae bacterium]|nr:mannosyltransferase family protein [Thermoleophilaceae bacterium]
MTFQATPARARSFAARLAAIRRSEALRAALRVALPTRAAVLLVAVFAAVSFGPATGGLARENADKFDEPALTAPLAEPLLAPLARWDSVWYLTIADSGYRESAPRAAFFPLYPLLIRSIGTLFGGSEAALLVAAYLVSLAAFAAALALLYKLVVLERGRQVAPATLLLLAVFPAAVFFGAPYSESLFLLLAVGAFYAARTDRWAAAGACAMAAAATRSAGLILLIPLVMLWWSSSGRRPRDAAWLCLAPLGLVAYAAWLGLMEGDALRFLDVQDAWSRELTVPLAGAWQGFTAALDGVRQLASGSRTPVYFDVAAGDSFRIAGLNIMLFATLVFAVCACVGVLRRLPKAYGAWVGASLVLPLTFPVTPQPLMSLPRFVAVLFPIFVWLAIVCDERRITTPVAAFSAIGLGLFTAQYASWHWIS